MAQTGISPGVASVEDYDLVPGIQNDITGLGVGLFIFPDDVMPDGANLFKSAVHGVIILGLLLGLSVPESVKAQTGSGESTDYNDYVQSVYSSNNGLPCGEANDIAQTNDGVLWIGTYAGLYRYNGREFRWVDNYESVRNVNCLYVDEEGRLWIGTNDNGLSIVIREKVVNVLDQTSGLPSDSVRCIIRATDGYYYVGTTDSMQVVVMNNGLKVSNILHEIKYADSITADESGHVATTASDGQLFLLSEGAVVRSLELPDDQEIFNCCSFAPDGTLMVGSSTNHIYCYDISGDDFKLINTVTCEGANSINNVNFLSDGTMFVSTDSGVAYSDESGYHKLNTNDFNNSIDKMLCDYQGNLWFTSSRLGLLRLAKSPFKDVYGAIGMERRVVNAIVSWKDCYYIGTDKGLDVVDRACRLWRLPAICAKCCLRRGRNSASRRRRSPISTRWSLSDTAWAAWSPVRSSREIRTSSSSR